MKLLKKKRWKIIKKIFYFIFILICITILTGSFFIKKVYSNVAFEELYFYIFSNVKEADNSLIIMGIKYCSTIIIFVSIFLYIILCNMFLSKLLSKKEKIVKLFRFVLSVLIFILSIFISLHNLNFKDYYNNLNVISNFIENNYVNPKETEITFPDNKRNLIIIIAESLETSMFTKEQGGYWEYEVIPELYELLNDDETIVFYNKNKTELMKQLVSSSWTTGGDVAYTTGLPLKIPIQISSYHSKNFMHGAYGLGDILKDNGYYNEFVSSAKTSFGGLKELFYNHGNYKIIDINSYKYFGFSTEEKDLNKWGFNDNYLFKISKERLIELSKSKEPFNLIIQTIDTHYYDGFVEWYTKDKFDTQYENVYAAESLLIYNFINWIKKQDFYRNTTILIVGDHVSMQSDYFKDFGASERYIYNCIINSVKGTKNNDNRVYTSLDIYPTILSSIGVKINGNKLGLGIDLFSGDETLAEKYGFDYINNELTKKSVFYNKMILGKDYDIMSGEVKNDSRR